MMRWLFRLIVAATLAYGWWWLRLHDGELRLQWQGYVVAPRLSVIMPLLLLLWFMLTRFDRMWCWLKRAGSRGRDRRSYRQQQQLLEQVLEGFTALAAGEPQEAKRISHKLGRRVSAQSQSILPLYHLLAAKVAQQQGNRQDAAQHFQAMQKLPQGQFMGLRGMLALERPRVVLNPSATQEEKDRLHQLASEAYALKPQAPWAALAMLESFLLREDLTQAQRILHRAKGKAFSAVEYKRLMAVVDYLQAVNSHQTGDTASALRQAAKAVKQRPGFVPASLLLARIWEGKGDTGKSQKTLRQAWRHQPHPDIAEDYLAQTRHETPEKRAKAIQQLVSGLPHHSASYLLLIQSAWDRQAYEEAARLTQEAWQRQPGWSLWQWMQRLQREGWMEKGMLPTHCVQDDPAWRCQHCSAVHAQWQLHCGDCSSLDSIRWDRPHSNPTDDQLLLLDAAH